MSFMDEIRKIPPVTRFLCASSLAVTLPVLLQILPIYKVVFVKEFVTQKFEIWRVFTSFFLGSSGINFIFDLAMLYRNSNELETTHFPRRSSDYAWQLSLAGLAILGLNVPLGTFVHTRALLLALTYVSSRLAPPGSQTSFFGLITFPVIYLPYMLVGMDLLMGGPGAAAISISGAVVGHLWWWTVFDTGSLRSAGTAPAWLRGWFGESASGGATGGVGGVANVGGGVHVVPPRRVREEAAAAASGVRGHSWGTGRRLGE
ncbi:Derlin-2 [Trametes pubescens]|uniref:Derlin n=1 Tax=Trametes pubescens TaxID=154538 RepID=A0A1M2V765_TRAPU|nr:Derlin-2 [Trametes pubescens]